MDKNEFIEELLTELSYRSKKGYPDFNDSDHIQLMAEILDDWGLTEIKDELINSIISEDPDDEEETTFETPILNKEVEYQDSEGNRKTGKIGNLLRKGEDTPPREAAEQALQGLSDEERDEIDDELGSQRGNDTDPDMDFGDDDDNEMGGDQGEEDSEMGSSVDPDTEAGQDYIDSLPDDDPAKKQSKKSNESLMLELYENVGSMLNEASVWQNKYGIGTRFIAITNTEDLFKDGLPEGEKVPKGFYTKVSETDDVVEVDLGGNQEVYMLSDDTKKVYKITASKNKLRSMFGHMRKGASPNDINWNTEVLETAACLGVYTDGYSILKKLNDDVQTDDDLPDVINDITKQVSSAFGKSGDYANLSEIESKIDKMHLADWYQLASLMAGMSKFTDELIQGWSSRYIIHKSIDKYYKVIDKSELVKGSKQNTADLVISNTPIPKLIQMVEDDNPVEFDSQGICYIPNSDVKWIQVSLKKARGGAQLGKIYSFLKDKFELLDNADVLDIALHEGMSDWIKKGKDFIKSVSSKFIEKLKGLGSFASKIGSKISKGFTRTPKRELDSLQRQLERVGLKGKLNEGVLYESKTMFETLEEIGQDKKLLSILVDNVNSTIDEIDKLSKRNTSVWSSNVKKLKPKTPLDPDTVGKILSNYQGASLILNMIDEVSGDAKELYRNLVELEKEMVYGKTTLPLYKVFGMDINDKKVSYKQYPGSEEFVEEKIDKDIDDIVVIFFRITEQGDYYTFVSYGLNDVDEDTGKFEYTQYRIGTNASGRYSFNFEGVRFIELGKIKKLLGIK